MPILHLGVIDLPYASSPAAKGKRTPKRGSAVTTGDVATFLEDKYHVMEVFFNQHAPEIGDDLAKSVQGALENLLLGAPPQTDPFGTATSAIEARFQTFIDLKEMDKLGYPGVPTAASIKGIRSRFKKRLDPGRPSFQDSGQYEASFRAWVD